MSITYPLTPPDSPKPKQVTISSLHIVGVSTSPFTGESDIQEWPGEFLQLDVTLPTIKDRVTAEAWIAFLVSCRGAAGTFLYGDPCVLTPLGSPSGTPLTNGTQVSGSKVLVTNGWTANRQIFRAGDYIQVGTSPARLYKVMKDVSSDASGNATLDIFPRLREQLEDNTPIVFTNPRGIWRLNANKSSWQKDETGRYNITFSATEAL